jgi:homoserine kinase
MSSVTVFAPATVANLGSGFDVFGLAIGGLGDVVRMEPNNYGETRIRGIRGDEGKLSVDPDKNTAGVALAAFLQHLGVNRGFDLWLTKKMPMGSGMGSSAASAAAAVVAANHLLGNPCTREELVFWAMQGERIASGAAHADNVAPAILGGITLVRTTDPLEVLRLPVPPRLQVAILHPHRELPTSESRSVLPKQIPLSEGVRQWANTAALVAGLYAKDLALIGRAMEDRIAEPSRGPLIPGFAEVKSAALQAGALACTVSGAGPSMIALCSGRPQAERVGKAMQEIYQERSWPCGLYLSSVNRKGAVILKR